MADRGIPRRVTYREVDEGYFDKRGLQRHAGVWSLWALGVAARSTAPASSATSR
jgi:hypothetical protein